MIYNTSLIYFVGKNSNISFRKLKRDIEGLEEDLERSQRKNKQLQIEKEEISDDYSKSAEKIRKLDFKLDQQTKEIASYLEEISNFKVCQF